MTPRQPMTAEAALEYLQLMIGADSERERHYGPKSVYVVAEQAFAVLTVAIKPEAPGPEKPKSTKGRKGGKGSK